MHRYENLTSQTYGVWVGPNKFKALKGRKLHRKNPPILAVIAFAVIGLLPLVHV